MSHAHTRLYCSNSLGNLRVNALRLVLFSCAICVLYVSPVLANDSITATKPSKNIAEAAIETSRIEPPWKSGLAGSFLSSRFAKQHQDVAEAARYLAESLKRDPDNEALQQESMRAHLMAGNMMEATALAKKLESANGRDPLVATLLMIDHLHSGEYAKARARIEMPSDRGLFGIIKPVLRQWLNIASGGLAAPVSMQEAIDKSGFFAPFLTYHTALMNDVLGFSDIARQHYVKSSEDAAVTPYRVVEAISNFYLRQGERGKAQAVFDVYAKDNPESNLIPDSLPGGNDLKVKPLVSNPSEGLAELFFSTASILFGEEMTSESFIYLRLALALRPDLPPAQLMLANLYESNEEYDEAIRLYDAIKPGSVFYKRARIRKALNIEATGKVETAIELLDAIVEEYPKDEAALITLGDIYREQKRFENAIVAYTKAVERIGILRASDWPLLYARGIAFERSDQWKFAEQDFEAALKLEPNQPDVLNYLGYSWLLMGRNLDRALEYIEIASSARPDDAHIMDSLGWAYFVTKQYDKALETLEKAAELMPQDPTVNDHLGDAYYKVGRKTEAEYQWKRALSFKPEKVDAKRIREKIARGTIEESSPNAASKSIGQSEPVANNHSNRTIR